jgi:hypothetical protein
MQEVAHLGPMLRQCRRRQRVELCKIGALCFGLGEKIGQPAPQRRCLREAQRAATLLQIPMLHQSRQEQALAHRSDLRRQVEILGRRIEQEFVFVDITERMHFG